MLSPEAEIESLRSTVARFFSVYGVVVSPMALTFQVGAPPGGIGAPFDALRIELVPKDYIPTITQEKGETLVHVQRRPRPRFARTQVNLILLLVTVLTTTFFGGAWNWADYSGQPFLSVESIGFGGLFFTLPLLTILGSHEMGHYLVAKRYKVQASLPFFLPSVPPLGTFGAFISMRDPIPNRRALLDIGVSGPLVGFAIAIPVTLAGLALSAASPASGLTLAGEAQPSLLFRGLSLFFPLPQTLLTHPHPLAFAGWVGLFVTAINLLPAGQLDGGHVARALLGINQTIALRASLLLTFAVNNTGPIRESVIMGAKDQNLVAYYFVILFTSYRIGSVSTAVNSTSVTIMLNASQRAVFDLQVRAPTNWSGRPLPQYVSFLVTARTSDGLFHPELPVDLRVTA